MPPPSFVCQAVQQIAVAGYEDADAVEGRECVLRDGARRGIQVVGQLVHDQYGELLGKEAAPR